MTRFKEGARIERAIETKNPGELRWAVEYARGRERTATTDRHRRHWQAVIRRIQAADDPVTQSQRLRRLIRDQRGASPTTQTQIADLLERFPEDPDLSVLYGDAIQLGDGSGPSLGDAKRCYERALRLDPQHAEAATELEHFIDVHGPDV